MSAASPDRSAPPPPGPAREFRFPRFERRRLAGGLDLYAAPLTDTPLVYLLLASPGGAHYDPLSRPGLAALTAALLDEGTERRSSRQIADAVEGLGGHLYTGAGWDAAYLAVQLLSRHLDTGLELLAEVARSPSFPDQEVERLRSRTLAELRRRWTDPDALAELFLARALYSGTPYQAPVLGTEASLHAVTRKEIAAFYRRHIPVAGSALIAVGELDPDGLAGAAEAAFADSFSGTGPERGEIRPPALEAVQVEIVDRPRGAQTELRVGHPGIPRVHPDYFAVQVLNAILGGKFTSRLMLNLREKRGITYSAGSSFSRRLGPGPFVVSAAVETESVGEAVTEVLAELRRIREEPVTEEELAETSSYLLGVFPYTVQTLRGVARRLEDLAVYGLPDDYYDTFAAELSAVGRDEVLRAARSHLHPDRLAVIAVGPAEELLPQLERFGPVPVREPGDKG